MVEETRSSGLRRAAVLVTSMDPDSAAMLMAQFGREDQERIDREITRFEQDPPPREERAAALREFHAVSVAQQYLEQGGTGQARQILRGVLPVDEVGRILESMESASSSAPFSFLRRTDADHLLTFISDEHPQTIALVLAYLDVPQAADILEGLPARKQQEVVRRLVSMDHTTPEVLQEVESELESRLSSLVSRDRGKVGGVGATAEILNLVSRSTGRNILESLEAEDSDVVEQIRRHMFTFEDILRINDMGMRKLMEHIDLNRLSLSLKTAPEELKEKFFRNMTATDASRFREEMDNMGPVRLSDVEAAQQAIVDIVRGLEERAEIVVEGRRGGGGEVIV